jgi:hypothetical protein
MSTAERRARCKARELRNILGLGEDVPEAEVLACLDQLRGIYVTVQEANRVARAGDILGAVELARGIGVACLGIPSARIAAAVAGLVADELAAFRDGLVATWRAHGNSTGAT